MKYALALALSGVAAAASLTQPLAPRQQPTCAAAEFHQFDFWLGRWRVMTPDGQLAGHNRIERILDGCVLHESWTGRDSSRGESFNIYDRWAGRWHQTWVDQHGLLLQLDGGLRDSAMVMEGERLSPEHTRLRHRITWTPLDPQTVRQLWQRSRDGGTTWETVFDGRYVRESPS